MSHQPGISGTDQLCLDSDLNIPQELDSVGLASASKSGEAFVNSLAEVFPEPDLLISSGMKHPTALAAKDYGLAADDGHLSLGSLNSMGLCSSMVSNFLDPIYASSSASTCDTGHAQPLLPTMKSRPSSWLNSLIPEDTFTHTSAAAIPTPESSLPSTKTVPSALPAFEPQYETPRSVLPSNSTGSKGSTSFSEAAPPSSARGTKTRGNKAPKVCEVCSDRAKSNHFGGVSCDSCKAFFRRAVYSEAHSSFRCHYDGACVITMATRKQCQACRFKKCLAIGMEMKMVMNDDERLEFLKRRSQKKQDSTQEASTGSAKAESLNVEVVYQPNVAEMSRYMRVEDQLEIEEMMSMFHQSYVDIPYNASRSAANRSSLEIIEMFTTILRRMVYFHKMRPDFNTLIPEDQATLLRQGVLEMCMLRSAFTFDPKAHQWPLGARKPSAMQVSSLPQLASNDAKKLVSSDLYQMHIRFIASVQSLQVDEKISIIMNHIVLYYPDRIGLKEPGRVSFIQEKYLRFLQNYTAWKYGPAGSRMYAKLLGKLSDLRQLNDSHTEYNLRLAQTEIMQIQKTLSGINLNPYPEWSVVPCDQTKGIGIVEPVWRTSFSVVSTTTSASRFKSLFSSQLPTETFVPTIDANTQYYLPAVATSLAKRTTESQNKSYETYYPSGLVHPSSTQFDSAATVGSGAMSTIFEDVTRATATAQALDLPQCNASVVPSENDLTKLRREWAGGELTSQQLVIATAPTNTQQLSVHHQHHHHVYLHHGYKTPPTQKCDPAMNLAQALGATQQVCPDQGTNSPAVEQNHQFNYVICDDQANLQAPDLPCLPSEFIQGQAQLARQQDLYRFNYRQYQQPQSFDFRRDNALNCWSETTTTTVSSYARRSERGSDFHSS